MVAFAPAVVIGFLAYDFIKTVLFETPQVVCIALIVGGVILLLLDRMDKKPRWLDAEAFSGHAPDHHHDHHHHDPNRHDASISAFCLTFGDPLDWTAMGMWLQMLVASHGANLLRVKGILNLRGHDRPVAIHAVRHLIHPPAKLTGWPADDPRTSRLVFITRDLPRATVAASLPAFQAAGTGA